VSDPDTPPDPFAAFDSERTVIKPSAGRGSRTAAAKPAQAPPAQRSGVATTIDLPALPGFNPIVAAAAPLLAMAPRLRAMASHPDPAGLRAKRVWKDA
jgi:type VI secretion system protein ImpK